MKRKTERKVAGLLRAILVSAVILLQIILLILLVHILHSYAIYIYVILQIIGVIHIFAMISRSHNTPYAITWILAITLLPVIGLVLFHLWGQSNISGRQNKPINESIARGNTYLEKDSKIYTKLSTEHPRRKRIAGYLGRKNFPLYQGTKCEYFPLGELQFDTMIKDMEKAEKFIFMEYFIINTGKLWDRISDILIRKAAQGVEVRLMYDDLGSITTVPDNFIRTMGLYGIQVARFNPVHRFIPRLYVNFRNHQKIVVIDGNIGYTGGTNLADEYANYYPKHGHWKDTAIRLEGDAVWSLTVSFLQMWDSQTKKSSDYEACHPDIVCEDAGFFQPFTDGPTNNPDNPAEAMYRSMITNARDYVYITTPYLVIDNTMVELLCTAAIGGVDVRIVTPKIWDQWYVHMVTRSNYSELLKAGVRIYEYTPGYIHAKTIISDDDHAVTGSINMDYRSFHLHFENGVWICGAPVLGEIKKDIIDTFNICEEMYLEDMQGRPLHIRFAEGFLRIFAVMF